MSPKLIGLPGVSVEWCKGDKCYTVRAKRERGFEVIYHDFMERWKPIPWWRKVWNYVVRKKRERKRSLSILR